MKHNLQKTSIFLYLCLVTILFSCTNEKEFIENGNSQKLKAYQKNFKDLMLLKNFNTAYNKVLSEKSKNLVSRSAIEEEYKFTIAEDVPIKVFEYNSKLFYNILIFKDSVNSEVLENLVLKVENIENQEEVSAYIIKYGLTNAELTDEKEIVNLFGRFSQFCSYACSPMCTTMGTSEGTTYSSPHPMSSGECTFSYWGNCTMDCVTGGGGGFGGPNSNGYGDDGAGSDGSTGGSGGGSATPQDTIAAPNNDGAGSGNEVNELIVALVEDEEEEETPCATLRSNLSTTNGIKLKSILPNLQAQVLERGERGKLLMKASNGSYSTPDVPATTNLEIKMSFGTTIFGSIHTHPRDLGRPMFSFSDVFALKKFYETTTDANVPEVVIYLVCKELGDNKTFALKVDDYSTFDNAIYNFTAANSKLEDFTDVPPEEKLAVMLKNMDKIVTKHYADNISQDDREAFLALFSNFGISLYQLNETETDWDKLTLGINNKIRNVPCNR